MERNFGAEMNAGEYQYTNHYEGSMDRMAHEYYGRGPEDEFYQNENYYEDELAADPSDYYEQNYQSGRSWEDVAQYQDNFHLRRAGQYNDYLEDNVVEDNQDQYYDDTSKDVPYHENEGYYDKYESFATPPRYMVCGPHSYQDDSNAYYRDNLDGNQYSSSQNDFEFDDLDSVFRSSTIESDELSKYMIKIPRPKLLRRSRLRSDRRRKMTSNDHFPNSYQPVHMKQDDHQLKSLAYPMHQHTTNTYLQTKTMHPDKYTNWTNAFA